MTRWEYSQLVFAQYPAAEGFANATYWTQPDGTRQDLHGRTDIISCLTEFGAEGWEVVGMDFDVKDLWKTWLYLLKRPIQE
jgi:hypothetical protein